MSSCRAVMMSLNDLFQVSEFNVEATCGESEKSSKTACKCQNCTTYCTYCTTLWFVVV